MAFHLCEYGSAWPGQMVQHVKNLVTMYTLIWFFPCVSIGESVMIANFFFLLDVLMREFL